VRPDEYRSLVELIHQRLASARGLGSRCGGDSRLDREVDGWADIPGPGTERAGGMR
jgi:hypothetical protein